MPDGKIPNAQRQTRSRCSSAISGSHSHPLKAAAPVRDEAAARAKTELLIRIRDRSERELANRLEQAGFPARIVEAEVARAVALGLVDDERFIRLYIQGKTHKGWGQRRIAREIRRFGIDLEHAGGYPELFFDEAEELRRAETCVAAFSSRAKDPYRACLQKLMYRGFSSEIAHRAMRNID